MISGFLGVLLVGALLGAEIWVVAVALLGYVVVSRPLTPRVGFRAALGLLLSVTAYVALAVAIGLGLTAAGGAAVR
ncbi:MAG TPA: hypothetical protein VNO23_10275 [Candidatus Binatia bacterium]|nr:hypothetical protein [Candidatus Binatia bacterium]